MPLFSNSDFCISKHVGEGGRASAVVAIKKKTKNVIQKNEYRPYLK
jgi:hypothetical protein